MKNRWWLVAAAVIVAGTAWFWYARTNTGDQSADVFRRTAVARRGDLVVSITASGSVNPIEKVDVKSKASGEILELPIEEGDFIRKGDLIARLDRTTAQNDYDQAKADWAVADVTVRQRDRERNRVQTLFDQKLASESELDNARLAYEEANSQLLRAQANLSTTKERLDDTEIRSPIDGLLLSRPVDLGQIISSGTTTVTGGTLLCTVANMSKVYVVADVDETDIGKVQVGMEAAIKPDAFPDKRLGGTVQRIAPLAKVQQNVTLFEVTTLVDNADFLLKAGMNATVEVTTASAENALLIPVKAIEWTQPPAHPNPTDTGTGGLRAEGMHRPRGGELAGRNGADSSHYGQRGGWSGPRGMGGQNDHGGPGGGATGGAWAGAGGPTWGQNGKGGLVPSVEVLRNGVTTVTSIRTGLSNVDDIVVVSGLTEGDTVVFNLASGAMQQRADTRNRMSSMSGVPGLRRTN